jgi:hypothetical protein
MITKSNSPPLIPPLFKREACPVPDEGLGGEFIKLMLNILYLKYLLS